MEDRSMMNTKVNSPKVPSAVLPRESGGQRLPHASSIGARKSLRFTWLIVLAAVCLQAYFVSQALSQTVTGIIVGTVVDPTGAVVVGASVQIVSAETVAKLTTETNEAGQFTFSGVQPNTYVVVVNANGFKQYRRERVVLTATERHSVGTLALQIGAATESVVVEGGTTPIQTMSSERSAMLDSQQLQGLNTRGRDYLSLLGTLPGVVPGNTATQLGDAGAPLSIDGGRRTQTSMLVDGQTGNDPSSTEATNIHVNMDAVSEVKVQLTNYQAEYGRSGSAIINAVTKSGTSKFHGAVYSYIRNEAFNANDYFNNLNGVKRRRYRYFDTGWNIGGPVYIPGKLSTLRDKLYFFFSQEILRSSTPGSLSQVTEPTQLERNGDFSQTLTTNGTLQTVIDPLTKQPFPGNVVPTNRIDPNGQKLLSLFPLPNFTNRSVSLGNYNFLFTNVAVSPRTEELFRIDYNVTEKLHAYYRQDIWASKSTSYAAGAGVSSPGLARTFYSAPSKSGILSTTYTFSPTLVNEASFAVSHWLEAGGPVDATELAKINRGALGITTSQLYPNNNPLGMIPWMSFGNAVPGMVGFSTDQRFPIQGASTWIDFTEGLSKAAGTHLLKAGIFLERNRMNKSKHGTFPGSISFSQDTSNPGDTTYGFANALLGNYDSYSESNARPIVDMRSLQTEWYLQDTWRITKKLTLDYGLRFNTYIPFHQADGKSLSSSFDPAQFQASQAVQLYLPGKAPVAGQTGAIIPGSGNPSNGMVLQANASKGFQNNQGIKYAPRFGFAYDPKGDGKTAIRGGIGVFYNPLERGGGVGGTSQSFIANPPNLYTPTLYYGTLSQLSPGNAPSLISSGVIFPAATALGIDPAGKTPTFYNFSLGVQRQLGFNTVLDIAYVGNVGRFLQSIQNLNTVPYGADFLPQNQNTTLGACPPTNPGCAHLSRVYYVPYAGYSNLEYFTHSANSNYHSLQAQLNHRFSKGLQFGLVYTYSKAMGYTDGADEDFAPVYRPMKTIYGFSTFDRTHNAVFNWLWDIPNASKLWDSVIARTALDNWHLNGIATFVDGAPAAAGFNTNPGIDISGGGDFTRIQVVGNPVLPRGQRNRLQYFNTAAFAEPALYTYGNAGKWQFRGPGMENFDLGLAKKFPIRERATVEFRWDAYNALNHTNWSGLNTNATFNATGAQTNSQFGRVTSDVGPRVMQGSLRISF
jgi:hypothetical protein